MNLTDKLKEVKSEVKGHSPYKSHTLYAPTYAPTEDLIEYLEKNRNCYSGEDHSHRLLVNDLCSRLGVLGITGDYKLYKEVMLLRGNIEVGKTDVIVATPDELYLIECKKSKYSKRRSTIGELDVQLKNAYRFFRNKFNIAGRCFRVYRHSGKKFEHEEVEIMEDTFARIILESKR